MAHDYTVGDTIYFTFTTRAFATGIPTTLAGTPVLGAYEDATATPITAGVSVTVDHDKTGHNLATIVATGGNGFEAGKHYGIAIITGTVGGVSVVGEVIGQFTLEKSAAAVRLPSALVGGRMDASVGALENDVPSATALRRAILGDVIGTASGTPTTTNIPTSSLLPAAAVIDQFKGRILTFDKDTTTTNLRGQATDITANTAAGVLTVTALTNAPVSGDTFVIT